MAEIGVQFSIIDPPLQVVTKTSISRRRRNPIIITHNNIFNHYPRSHQMQYSSVLPISSLPSLGDFKEKLTTTTTTNKIARQTITPCPSPVEFRLKSLLPNMPQTQLRKATSNRSPLSNMPKSSLSYPTTLTRPMTAHRSPPSHQQSQQQQPLHQQTPRFLHVLNTPLSPRRATSARQSHNGVSNSLVRQQRNLNVASISPRLHPQYGHFLAYLRRQSLARMRRKQDDDGCLDAIETTIVLHSAKPPLQSYQSPSNASFGTTTMTGTTITTVQDPTISLISKRKTRPFSSYRLSDRASSTLITNNNLNTNKIPLSEHPVMPPETLNANEVNSVFCLNNREELTTPTNSVVDETLMKKAPYELQLTGDMLNYCYVSDSGVKYQGQLLSAYV